ncbi:MAG TPA: CPBP family intramembrane glutamic endopeptidase [Lacibacter sp.]|nr:CPBP family intramembrane glutamic endopeptidase [Lacibacter sp.]
MEYKSVKGYGGWAQLGFLLLFTGVGLMIAAFFQFAIGFSLIPKGTSMLEAGDAMLKAMTDPKNVNTLRLMQVVSTLLMLALPAWVFMRLCHSKHWLWLGFSRYFTIQQVVLGIILIFCANMLAQPLVDVTKYLLKGFPSWIQKADAMEKLYNEQILLMSNLTGWGEYIVAIFIIAFFPALFEEMFFRGAVQSTLHRWWRNPWATILVTSVLFSLIHLSIYLFLSRLLLGAALGWIFFKSRNVWIGVIIHFFNNSFALSQVFYLKKTGGTIDTSKLDPSLPWWGVSISAFVLITVAVLFERSSKANANSIRIKEESLYAQLNPFGNIASSNSNQNLYS